MNDIACGDIDGPVLDDKVFNGLAVQNCSRYAGFAIVEKDGDDHIKVTVYLARGLQGQPVAPEATPTS